MELACTKKILDYLEVKAEKASADIDPLFGWTANMIMVNRRKTLVVVHPASRAMFVVHGLTMKLLPKLSTLIIDGLRTMLASERVRPEIIEKYLDDCGWELSIRANSSRTAIAACNRACERLTCYSDIFAPDDLYQKPLLPTLNADVACSKEYCYAFENLLHMLRQRYGEDILSCRMVELEVELQLHTPCKRVLRVPADMNFYQLHKVLQLSFGWENCHAHHFLLKDKGHSHPMEIIAPADPDDLWEDFGAPPCRDSTAVTLEDVFRKKRKIEYEYDFGDGWMHVIRLRRFINDCPQVYPQCIQAIGDSAVEDSGGPYGFAQMDEILRDPSHPDYEKFKEWIGNLWPNTPDPDKINRKLYFDSHQPPMPVFYY